MSENVKDKEYEDGIYTGTINAETGKREGLGKFIYTKESGWKNGCVYDGCWQNDVKHGSCTLYWQNGTKWFEGEYTNDKKMGKCILYYVNGKIWYKGSYKNDFKHGTGTIYYDNKGNDVNYSGEFEEDNYQGFGTLLDEKKNIIYSGLFDKNEYNGVGTLYFKNSSQIRYEGGWSKGLYHGKGVLFQKDRSNLQTNGKLILYFGHYDMGIKSGYGEQYSKESGRLIYRGFWQNDKYHGLGIKCSNNGSYNWAVTKESIPQCISDWKEDKVNGFSQIFHTNTKKKIIGGFYMKNFPKHYYNSTLKSFQPDNKNFKKHFCQTFARDGSIIDYGSYDNDPDQVYDNI